MLKDETPLCDYCGKPVTWNNDILCEYINPVTGFSVGSYCSKECLMKDNGLKEEDCKYSIAIRNKAKEK